MKITVAIASDHAGFEYKEMLKSHLEAKAIKVTDFGTYSDAPETIPISSGLRRIRLLGGSILSVSS